MFSPNQWFFKLKNSSGNFNNFIAAEFYLRPSELEFFGKFYFFSLASLFIPWEFHSKFYPPLPYLFPYLLAFSTCSTLFFKNNPSSPFCITVYYWMCCVDFHWAWLTTVLKTDPPSPSSYQLPVTLQVEVVFMLIFSSPYASLVYAVTTILRLWGQLPSCVQKAFFSLYLSITSVPYTLSTSSSSMIPEPWEENLWYKCYS